jgi:hypothetical protein
MSENQTTPPDGFLPYESVPKDGRTLELWAPDADGPFRMAWHPGEVNPLVSLHRGIWVSTEGAFTWCDDRPDGAPTHWRSVQ